MDMETAANSIAMYYNDGVRIAPDGCFNGKVTYAPMRIKNGSDVLPYGFEVEFPGYVNVAGSFNYQDRNNASAGWTVENAESFTTDSQGLHIKMIPAGDPVVNLVIKSEPLDSTVSVTDSQGNEILPESGNYPLPIPDISEDYTFKIKAEGCADFAGSFTVNADETITDTTSDESKKSTNFFKFDEAQNMYSVVLVPVAEIVPSADGKKATVRVPIDFGNIPGEKWSGKVIIRNSTDTDFYVNDYNVGIKSADNKWDISPDLLRPANKAIYELYMNNGGWTNEDNTPNLADIYRVDDKIKEVYGGRIGSYSEYLREYYQVPELSSEYLSDEQIAEIFSEAYDRTGDDCWFAGTEADPWGNISDGERNQGVADGSLRKSSGRIGAAEIYDDIDELGKEYLFKNGLLFDFVIHDAAGKAPSLYDWSMKTCTDHFKTVFGDGRLSAHSDMLLDGLYTELYGAAFHNSAQEIEWDTRIDLMLGSSKEETAPPESSESSESSNPGSEESSDSGSGSSNAGSEPETEENSTHDSQGDHHDGEDSGYKDEESQSAGPQTGDNSMISVWIAILVVSGVAVLGVIFGILTVKRKKSENK